MKTSVFGPDALTVGRIQEGSILKEPGDNTTLVSTGKVRFRRESDPTSCFLESQAGYRSRVVREMPGVYFLRLVSPILIIPARYSVFLSTPTRLDVMSTVSEIFADEEGKDYTLMGFRAALMDSNGSRVDVPFDFVSFHHSLRRK